MSDEQSNPSNVVRLGIDIDQSSLTETLALVERIEAAALRAGEALAAIGVVPVQGGAAFVEAIADQTRGMILGEMRVQTKLMQSILRHADREIGAIMAASE